MSPKGMSDMELLETITGRKDMSAVELKRLMGALAEIQKRNWERFKYDVQ